MPPLTDDEVAAFLDERGHLVRIATVDDDGMPLVIPAWYLHRDRRVFFTPRARSAWRAYLERDPRVCIVVDEEAAPYRKVVARGRVDTVHPAGDEDAWREDVYRALACRYLDDAVADAYLTATWNEPRPLLALSLADAEVTTWRMPVTGEDPRGIWASRYYHDRPSGER